MFVLKGCHNSSKMERYSVIEEFRSSRKLPPTFVRSFPIPSELVSRLVYQDPQCRPSAVSLLSRIPVKPETELLQQQMMKVTTENEVLKNENIQLKETMKELKELLNGFTQDKLNQAELSRMKLLLEPRICPNAVEGWSVKLAWVKWHCFCCRIDRQHWFLTIWTDTNWIELLQDDWFFHLWLDSFEECNTAFMVLPICTFVYLYYTMWHAEIGTVPISEVADRKERSPWCKRRRKCHPCKTGVRISHPSFC